MKQVTNEVYRTKRKLKLLKEEGIGQLLFDFYQSSSTYNMPNWAIEQDVSLLISELKQKYLFILEDYKPNEQIKMDL